MKRTCSLAGCEEPHRALGLCGTHYQRLKRRGTTDAPEPRQPLPSCTHEGCDRQATYRTEGGLCPLHYHEVWRGKHQYQKCSMPNCGQNRKYTGVGLCSTHYKARQLRAHR